MTMLAILQILDRFIGVHRMTIRVVLFIYPITFIKYCAQELGGYTLSGETLSDETFVGRNYSVGEIFVTR